MMMLRLSKTAAVLLLTAYTANAWIIASNRVRPSSFVLMASKGAEKWEKKKAWLASRGLGADGLPLNNGGSTAATTTSTLHPVTIIGGGRIGSLLAQAGGDESSSTTVLGRGDSIDADGSGPILIATRNDALDSIVDACPENRRKDLVFLQNGYLDGFLSSKGLLDNTQALLYLSVPSLGATPVDGVTAVNPEGLTAATGEHAQSFAGLLASLNLKCNVVTAEEYRAAMFEKLIWIATYMLVGTAKGCSSVGQAGEDYKELVEQVVTELTAAVSAKEGTDFQDGTMERLDAYTDVVADFPCAVKEFEWRNQYFYNLGDDACPTHNALLRECQEKGALGFELP